MKVLITGGGGYIARNLNRLMTQAGYTILAPTRQELDVSDIKKLWTYVESNQLDTIIHTAFRGGNRMDADTYEDFVTNIRMFENLVTIDPEGRNTILFGSGAEFDRRWEIDNAFETDIFESWPIDLYGLAKNQISRRALTGTLNQPIILRLFGCFSEDEETFRFIKRSIIRLKEGLPIQIMKNKDMDFFYMDDVFRVIDYILKQGGKSHINLVYSEKTSLLDIAYLIQKHTNTSIKDIQIISTEKDKSYTGYGWELKSMNIPLIGLEEGIKRTCQALT